MDETATKTEASKHEFWRAIYILIQNYHAVNKKLSGTKFVEAYEARHKSYDLNTIAIPKDASDLASIFTCSKDDLMLLSQEHFNEKFSDNEFPKHGQYMLLTKLFYKNRAATRILQILDFNRCCFQSIPINACENADQKHKFSIYLKNDAFAVELLQEDTNDEDSTKTTNWLQFVLKPQLLKWSQSVCKDDRSKNIKSHSLIDVEEYTNLYAVLKEKYGQDMVNRWTESTDPLKFVYEDVAIATYLILLWKKPNNQPQNFFDMGCGNGLLVHILNSEGYRGYGVDIRKRKIWDIYPETTKLKEHTIIPNNYSDFQDVDWIIGNHSDELSPWIPVIAAMTSFDTKYFLLPCCAYEFSGKKFQRRCSKTSVYNDFLSYVREISIKCKFKTEVDRLKIPSTKRVAVVGTTRDYNIDEFANVRQEIDEFVKSEIQRNVNSMDLIIRQKEEPVRNCTQVDKGILDDIVMNIFEFLLKDDNHKEQTEKWRSGRSVSLQELACYLSKENLKNIKSECGGLKTLIKNKHEIFEVIANKVSLRYPKKMENRSKGFQYKRRSCFYFLNHPDGCPLANSECTFLHEVIKI